MNTKRDHVAFRSAPPAGQPRTRAAPAWYSGLRARGGPARKHKGAMDCQTDGQCLKDASSRTGRSDARYYLIGTQSVINLR
jgi:hypothetical protein